MAFNSLGLSADLLRAIEKQGYTLPTPIQTQAIPVLLKGVDLLAAAQTGTGKTAAFTLPMLQRLSSNRPVNGRPVRGLVLTPTRELAGQVGESVKTYGQFMQLYGAVVFGGVNINPQIKALRRGADIVVATPGRLLDHVMRRTIDLSKVEVVVLDEADRMLDMGFLPDMERILKLIPSNRQTALFSATFPDTIKKLAVKFLRTPQIIEVARPNTASATIQQRVYSVDCSRKRELLSYLMGSQNLQQVLVFTRTKRSADRLARQLDEDGIRAAAIHGDKSQGARERALVAFKQHKVRALVATDVAARGIDISQLSHVINYELPDDIENYVHRIGRTGRAGAQGEAISLVCAQENAQFKAIERMLKTRIERSVMDGFEPEIKPAANENVYVRKARRPAGKNKPRGTGARPFAQAKRKQAR